jgi:Natural resistance-associated macrophage protein-like
VLDEAHEGDIEGALGRIRVGEEGLAGWRRLITFLAIVGPGLIVMVGDNDAGGVSTYSQAGQDYGYSLLWVLLLLVPVLIVNQEMVVRLGAVTEVGHARLINERFGRFWGWFSVGDLFLLNFLTMVTEFIGVTLALAYFGVSKYIAVPIAAIVLVAITTSGSFRQWERAMFFSSPPAWCSSHWRSCPTPPTAPASTTCSCPASKAGSARTRSCSSSPSSAPRWRPGSCSSSSRT